MTDEIIAKARTLAFHKAPWADDETTSLCKGFRALDERYQASLTALDAACELFAATKVMIKPPAGISKWMRMMRAIKEFEKTAHSKER